MNLPKILLVSAISFGAATVHYSPMAHAAPQTLGSVIVFIRPVSMDDLKLPVDKVISGSRVAGISCIPKPVAKLPDAAVCYVATDSN